MMQAAERLSSPAASVGVPGVARCVLLWVHVVHLPPLFSPCHFTFVDVVWNIMEQCLDVIATWQKILLACAHAGSGILSSFSPAATLPGCFRPGEQHLPEHRVLITGAAGFIGFHTSKAIATTQPGTFVLGLDNFNPLYSPALKALRRQQLRSRTGY
jgi:hypothetical protein